MMKTSIWAMSGRRSIHYRLVSWFAGNTASPREGPLPTPNNSADNPAVRLVAVEAMARNRDVKMLPRLLDALDDPHLVNRQFAYKGLQEMLNLRPRPSESVSALRTAGGLRYLLNPGSIGQPRDGDARAGFAIADLEHEIVEFWRVPYEIAAVQSRMRAARLPEALAQRLSLGSSTE